MKKATSTMLTGSAAAVAIAVAGFGGLNAWFVSSKALADHEMRDDAVYTALSATLAALHKEMIAAEKQRRGKAVRNTEDSILLLKSMSAPDEHIERQEQRLRRELRDLEAMP